MTHESPTEPAPQPHPSPLDVWALARRDYLDGDSAPVVAERYGLSERTLRRRAAKDGWRRQDEAKSHRREKSRWERRLDMKGRLVERDPVLEGVLARTMADQMELLTIPDPTCLRTFAFRRAAECAAMDRPTQAVVWMRLVQQIERVGEGLDDDLDFSAADHLRAAFYSGTDASKGDTEAPGSAYLGG